MTCEWIIMRSDVDDVLLCTSVRVRAGAFIQYIHTRSALISVYATQLLAGCVEWTTLTAHNLPIIVTLEVPTTWGQWGSNCPQVEAHRPSPPPMQIHKGVLKTLKFRSRFEIRSQSPLGPGGSARYAVPSTRSGPWKGKTLHILYSLRLSCSRPLKSATKPEVVQSAC